MTKTSKILSGISASVVALGAVAFVAVPSVNATAVTDAWQQVTVNVTEELTLISSADGNTTLTPSATEGEVHTNATPLSVRSNVPWKIQWQAVQGEFGDQETTAAAGTDLTVSGFGAAVANASIAYQGNDAVATGNNVWSAQLAGAGANQTLAFSPLTTTLGTIWTGSATIDAVLTPTYSADIDATLTNDTYYGTIYYVLTENS